MDGDPRETSNYRPILVLPVCITSFERVVHHQIYSYITVHNLLHPHRSGFRPGHSNATALVNVTNYIYEQFQRGLMTGAVFLDFKKAFDTVDPILLLQKNYRPLECLTPNCTGLSSFFPKELKLFPLGV